jgi:hypothetical protein
LSITWDIVTKQHGGMIAIESTLDDFAELIVTIPKQMATRNDPHPALGNELKQALGRLSGRRMFRAPNFRLCAERPLTAKPDP